MRSIPRGPQPMTDSLVQRHRPLHLRGKPPRLLAEPGNVLPGQMQHQGNFGLAVGQGMNGRSNSVVHRLFLTSSPRKRHSAVG